MRRAVPSRVTVSHLHRYLRFSRDETLRLVKSVLKGERRTGWTVGVVFVADGRMRKLNAAYRGHRRTTDVLSFRYDGADDREGEVVVSLDQARRQAPAFDATYTEEVSRLIVHGVLHLLGYDDRRPSQRARMRRKEDRYLGKDHERTHR